MARPHVEIAHGPELTWSPESLPGWPLGARHKVLSADPGSGAATLYVELPPGWRRGPGLLPAASELLVLSGSVRIGGAVRGFGWYEWQPAGAAQQPWSTGAGCSLVLFARTGAPEFVPGPGGPGEGRVGLDTETMEWILLPVPGMPPGPCLKILRHDAETGEAIFLNALPPRFPYDVYEYHDCVEEIYCVAGDVWMGNAGTMRAGSYVWRPPYVTHGKFYSHTGLLMLVYCDGAVVNHHVADPRRTVEENCAEALAQGPPRDYLG